jgi:hypothetical protein
MVPISDASFSHLRLRMWGAQAFHCPVCHALPAAASPAVARPSHSGSEPVALLAEIADIPNGVVRFAF